MVALRLLMQMSVSLNDAPNKKTGKMSFRESTILLPRAKFLSFNVRIH